MALPKLKKDGLVASPSAFQGFLDALDVVGSWEWDVGRDSLVADALVATLFSVDPDRAEAGTPLREFVSGIHVDDRKRVTRQIGQCARVGGSYVAEYRVCSADGQIRWVLARGRFDLAASGEPLRGRGIIIDITPARMSEEAYVSSDMFAAAHPLERAAERCLAAKKAVSEVGDTHLQLLADMLLLEVGRRLAKLEDQSRRKLMN
ncbi:PAS domain-containing protein [Methylobacterium oxalidis]|uniref:histidine kinase n=1 Tax=Methylobacterium oxalidis TaxID=944322 RepID=A0A512J311_9HYPH|nr:PAS domain-containing protein [Methylobacterium oxalidis]GEP04303.1 hypothetical protein MOX02_23410 [Methylobacterium oxalidis]GJE32983.1 hypothetical protein LDDCCGHA_3182 [Methylobacterium oxalidis]GLS67178.1 hypothetical protein GCM10007888_55610 [Methylobacterium oxalidis]